MLGQCGHFSLTILEVASIRVFRQPGFLVQVVSPRSIVQSVYIVSFNIPCHKSITIVLNCRIGVWHEAWANCGISFPLQQVSSAWYKAAWLSTHHYRPCCPFNLPVVPRLWHSPCLVLGMWADMVEMLLRVEPLVRPNKPPAWKSRDI